MRNRALATTTLSAAALLAGAIAAPAASASDDHHRTHEGGGVTTVVLDPDLLPVLVDQLQVAPIAPGELSAPGGVAQVSFPITDVEDDEIEHSGGLRSRRSAEVPWRSPSSRWSRRTVCSRPRWS